MDKLKLSVISALIIIIIPQTPQAQEIFKSRLSDSINTAYTESKPMISADGKALFFARQNSPDNVNGKYDDQDIYFSNYTSNGWSEAENIGAPLNNDRPNGVVSIAPTGKSLFLLNSYFTDVEQDGLAISQKSDSGWSTPQMMTVQDFHNHSNYIDYFFSSNGKQLLIAVERDDSYGDQDLYVSSKNTDGSWSVPINLGERINTKKPEFSPFLAADNKTLFFASMGHKNYGGADIFYTKRLDSTWTNWSEPQNLGKDVNSSNFEAYYSIPANGTIGYYVSDNEGMSKSRDIFSVTIPYEFRPDPVIMLSGKFLADNKSDTTDFSVNFLTTSASESEVYIEYEAEGFNAILPTGGAYFFYVNKSGFISESHYLDLANQKEYMEEVADLHSVPIASGEAFTSHNIQFESETSELLASSYFELVRLLEILQQNDSLQIELTGHAHDFNDSLQNMTLSEKRLAKVKSFYTEQGINPARLICSAKGANSLSQENYKKHLNAQFDNNNRIDFKILSTSWHEGANLLLADDITVEKDTNNALLMVEEVKSYQVLFGFDKYRVNGNNEALKNIKADYRNDSIISLEIIGYTCNMGDKGYNKMLAEKRAKSVLSWLEDSNISSPNTALLAKGEENPLNENLSIAERALNRRVIVNVSTRQKGQMTTAK